MIISGQAFHWFDKQKCKSEFKRIIKQEGYVILFWNEKTESNDFMKSYYDLLKIYGTDYEKVNHSTNTDDFTHLMVSIRRFFITGNRLITKGLKADCFLHLTFLWKVKIMIK